MHDNRITKIAKQIECIIKYIPDFLEHQGSVTKSGYYQYSYSGDMFDDARHWNVGSSVYATKIMYSIGVDSNNPALKAALDYIKSFKHNNGLIYDSFVYRRGLLKNAAVALLHNNIREVCNKKYIRAETRQCYSALMMYNQLPDDVSFLPYPKSPPEIDLFLQSLSWRFPWDAGSHFSHMMFFLKLQYKLDIITEQQYKNSTDFSINWINKLQCENGSWNTGEVDCRQAINGAMKVISGFRAVDKPIFDKPEKLIDLCLSEAKIEHACDNFNTIYVLNFAHKLTPAYRKEDIQQFAVKKFNYFLQYYHSEQKGFSFYPNQANSRYYGVKITRGFNEADIHGTSLFIWGLYFITQLLDLDNIPLYEVVT